MKPEKQRIAIAEACGWKFSTADTINGEPGPDVWIDPDDGLNYGNDPLPDYLNDLNAMHEALNTLDNTSGRDLIENLCKIRGGWEHNTYFDLFVRSTAAQRAEAFLRTINKWEDE